MSVRSDSEEKPSNNKDETEFHTFNLSTSSSKTANAKIGRAPANQIAPFTGYGSIINQRANQNTDENNNTNDNANFEKSLSLTNILDNTNMTQVFDSNKVRYLSTLSVDQYKPVDIDRFNSAKEVKHGSGHSMQTFSTMIAPPYLLPSVSDLRDMSADTTEGHQLLENQGGSGLRSMTKQQILTVVMMAFANFCSTVLFSMIAPFFPREAASKGASQTEIGLIFGIFELCIFITSPFYGRYITVLGPKFLYSSGLLVTGCAAILFGILNLAPAGSTFIGLCFAVRIVEACADAAFITASFTIIANQFPTRVSTMIGLLETFSGLGFTFGPAVGGLLYELGGFGLPFFVAGGLLLSAGALSIPFIPQQRFVMTERGSIFRLLRMPSILIMNMGVAVAAISFGFIDPTLQPHLDQFNLSVALIGVMFLCISAVYTITAPLWGFFLDKKGFGKQVMVLGAILFSVGFLLLGPSPLLNLPSKLWIVAVGLVTVGFGCGALFIPPFNECIKSAKKAGIADNFQLYGMVSGLFQSSMSFGAFIGPTVGGVLADQLGFNWAASVVACIHLCYVIILAIYIIYEHRRCAGIDSKKDRDAYSQL